MIRIGSSAYRLPLRTLVLLALLGAAPRLASAEAARHDIRLSFDSASGEIIIQDRVTLSGETDYRFDLAAWLELERVRLNGADIEVRPKGGQFVVALADDGEHSLDFELAGRVPERGRDGSTRADSASSRGPDGSFLPAYDGWIPHDRSQPISYRIEASVPEPQRAVVTGRLIDESIAAGRYTVTVAQTRPGEAPSLFVGPYGVREQVRDGIRLRTYFHSELDAGMSNDYFDSTEAYLRRYRDLIGEYPYAGFHIVSAPLPVGLGFPGLTYIDRRIVPLPFMRTRSLAHEVLHNWWGNAVAVDYAAGNWSEGLTTYMADYALARDRGEEAARTMRVEWLRDYAALPASRDRPVRTFRSKQHQAAQVIGYNKVAFIFHMLSLEIGEAAFDAGIRRFWEAHRFSRASWRNLQQAFEHAANRDLDWFFRQWLDFSGAPRISLAGHEVSSAGDEYLIRVEVLQPVAGYRLQMPVTLTTEAGSETRRLTVETSNTLLEWRTPHKPVAIRFDPDNDVFRRLAADETPPILRDVTLNPATQTMIVGEDTAFVVAAKRLAERLADTPPVFLPAGQSREAGRPLLLIAQRDRLDTRLSELGIEVPDALPAEHYGAGAWTARLAEGSPVLVVTAGSSAELEALLRPLPHYGGQSYVLFDAERAHSRGVWQMQRGALYRNLRVD